jgi:hypothetical protein
MADLPRKPKSASKWKEDDLRAYNIRVVRQGQVQFFQLEGDDLPAPHPSNFLIFQDAQAVPDQVGLATKRLLQYLEQAMNINEGVNEASVDDFSGCLFNSLGYANPNQLRGLVRQRDLRFLVCGKLMHARPDIISEENGYVRFVQENKAHNTKTYSQVAPQLIAEAIAAFRRNNLRREEHQLAPLLHDVIPGIIMIGSFFSIPVTTGLVNVVRLGHFPEQATIVRMHLPQVANPGLHYLNGMRLLDDRSIIVSCYERFQELYDL